MMRNWNAHVFLVGIQNGTATVKSSMVVAQKLKHSITIWPWQFHF